MRRRVKQDEAAEPKAPAEDRTLDMFPEKKGLIETDQFGTVFYTHACGMRASTGIFKQWDWTCNSCGKPVPSGDKEALLEASEKKLAEGKPQEPEPQAEPAPQRRRRATALEGEKLPMPAGVREAGPGEDACPKCGARLTKSDLGVFFPCGHDAPEHQAAAAKPARPEPPPTIVNNSAPAGEAVTYVSGRELYSPERFNTYEVGPFTASTNVRPGETHAKALERLAAEMEAFMSKERKRKRDAYLATMREAK